jgi:hypothetical protein
MRFGFGGLRGDKPNHEPSKTSPQKIFRKFALNSTPQNLTSISHIYHAIRHALSTSKPRLTPIFLKIPSKKPHQKNAKSWIRALSFEGAFVWALRCIGEGGGFYECDYSFE